MAVRATYAGFDSYTLTGIRVTDRELGHGSYATVLELEYMGLKCAGKKIHELLLRQGDASYVAHRFEEECRLLSQIRHPNIVQFLGVCFQQGVRAPILVMEFLPTNLTSSIEQHGILPKEISYSILHDVALGLYYLHSQTPAIIHRDLSSNNMLLTTNMTAKISDLGVARILNLTALQVSRLTGTPGTPAYMLPEVMVANPRYDTCVDEFSYGILMIHMFSGSWPEPQVGPNRTEADGTMTPVSEAERREIFLRAIGSDHPLMDLILNCIHNHPQARIHAKEIVKQLAEMVLQFPATFAGRMEMFRQVLADAKEKRDLAEEIQRKDMVIQQSEYQISQLGEKLRAEKITEIDQLKVYYSSEVEQLRLQIRDLSTQSQLVKAEDEAEITELKARVKTLENQIENTTKVLLQLEAQLVNERVENRKLMTDLSKVQSDLTILNSRLQSKVAERDATIQMKDASAKRKDSEIEAKTRALEEKDATISAMSKQLTKARECLTTKKLVSGLLFKILGVHNNDYIVKSHSLL